MSPPFLSLLHDLLGPDNLLTDASECYVYSTDNSRHQGIPLAVAFGQDTLQIQRLIQLCNEYNVPIFPRGRGTGTTGGAIPTQPGIVLTLERMQKIILVDARNRFMQVEAGVINQAVQDAAKLHGQFWAPDPTSSAYCTVGGNLACNAGGPRAVKYGATRDNVLGLKAVTGSGDIITTGVFTTKGAVGYDLTRLLIGSEGTLAIITEATLKLTPAPKAITTFAAFYSDLTAATHVITQLMTQPFTPYTLEFLDKGAIDMIREYARLDLPLNAEALLLFEIESEDPNFLQAVTQAASSDHLLELRSAQSKAEAEALWRMRKALSPALKQIAPKKINEDVVVPVTAIPELISTINALAKKYQITIVNFGHAGNGNIHVNLLIDPTDTIQEANAAHCLEDLFALVIRLRGTLSGEHGIGLEKRNFVTQAIDAVTLDLMRKIKLQFDPKGILNPGKIFPNKM